MIQLLLRGGLGNQMFQYAAGYSLAKEFQTELVLDLLFLNTNLPIKHFTKRTYDLDMFGITNECINASPGTLMGLLGYAARTFSLRLRSNVYVEGNSIVDNLPFLLPQLNDPYYFSPAFFKLKNGAYIEGNFNNTKFFEKYEQEIRSIFDPDKVYDPAFKNIEEEISATNSVAVSIRRGDYVNAKNKSVFCYLSDSYYIEVIKQAKENIDDPHFYFFTVDYPDGLPHTFGLDPSEYTCLGKEYIGKRFTTYLRLLSICKHNIISNSTFSFWGAYLNKNVSKHVFFPTKWMYDKQDFDAPKQWHGVYTGY